MNLFPPLPAWDSMHPLLVHFPIALLLVAPLGLVGALFLPRYRRELAAAAFVLTVLGTIALVMAGATGEAAGELAENSSRAPKAILEQHEELAETARVLFIGLTLLLGVVVWGPALLKRRLPRSVETVLLSVVLAVFAGSAVLLINVAHQGGRLVHQYGVHARVAPETGSPVIANGADTLGGEAQGEGDEDGDTD